MASAPIYLCVRRTLDWENARIVEAHVRPDFRPKMHTWNATFDMPYHEFRHRLKQIAQANLERVAGAVRAPLDEVPAGAIVVPVDDDDWLSPELANRLRAVHDSPLAGYLWARHVVEPRVPLRRRAWFWLWSFKRSTCATNDYAVPRRPDIEPLVMNHLRAGRYFDENRARIRRIPELLSIQNRNLASQTAMAWRRPSITREELAANFARYRTLYASIELPGGLEWARPCVDQMAGLMRQIAVR
jgi:hypothetical protein